MIISCHNLKFDMSLSTKRLNKAILIFGESVIKRILCFSLYLLGVNRTLIATVMQMPVNSVKTLIKTLHSKGIPSFEDRRRSTSQFLPQKKSVPSEKDIEITNTEGNYLHISLPTLSDKIKIALCNKYQIRVFLLTLLNSGVITTATAAKFLELSTVQTQVLAKKLQKSDITELYDKRVGQKQEYKFNEGIKAEVFQQFAANAATGRNLSSEALSQDLKQRCNLDLPPRTIRHHIGKLGLSKIKRTLPRLINTIKKKLKELIIYSNLTVPLYPDKSLEYTKYLKRYQIICLSKKGVDKKMISHFTDCSLSVVQRWSSRFSIYDMSRSGHPLVFNEEIQLKIIALYCQTSPLDGYGRWTVRFFEKYIKLESPLLTPSPSHTTIHRILNKNTLKPHRSKYFLHITDPNFFPKMEHLISLYINKPDNLFCFDECPGIQILQRLAPYLQTEKMKIRLEEFEYIRHGTMDVFAFLDTNSGKVFTECHANHTKETLVKVFKKHLETVPKNEKLHYIMDNLASHSCYILCQIVAEYSDITCPPEDELDTAEKRRQWLQREDKRIVFHYTPFHGSWLNQVEIWFGILNQKCLNESYNSPEALYNAIASFVDKWNQFLARPFNWNYKGEGLHQKAVERFIKTLQLNANDMNISFMTKQLILMENLFKNYLEKIEIEVWKKLYKGIDDNVNQLKSIVKKEGGPKKKIKAEKALENLINSLKSKFEGNNKQNKINCQIAE